MTHARPQVQNYRGRQSKGGPGEIKVLVASRYRGQGGASRVTTDIARHFIDFGFRVGLAAGASSSDFTRLDPRCAVFQYRLPRGGRFGQLVPPAVSRTLFRRWYRRTAQKFNPDVVFCVTLDLELMRANESLNAPRIEHVHALHLDSFSKGQAYLQTLAKFATSYVASSRFTAGQLRDCVGIESDRVRVLYNGVDFTTIERSRGAGLELREKLGVAPDELLVGGVGKVDFVKGTDLFVRAAKRCRQRVPDVKVRFVWVGGELGEDRPYGLGVCRVVDECLGGEGPLFIPYQYEALPYLDALDVLVVSSRAESLPLSMMEAMALGKPVVAFDVGGVREVLDFGGGVVVPAHSTDDLGDAVALLLSHEEQRAEAGAAACETIKRHFDSATLLPLFSEAVLEAWSGSTGSRSEL